jgi:hypothetical protein
MKLIHINEAVFNRLLEDNRRPPFQDFYDSVVAFVDGIRRDPIETVPNETLKGCGLHNGELRKKLYDYGIITKDERIDEPYDETTGRQQSRYYVKYDWSERINKEMKNKNRVGNPMKKAFIRKLYNDYFGINEAYHTSKGVMLHDNDLGNDINMRGEIDTMLNSPLTMGVISDESAPEYVKQATDIYNNKLNKKIR